MGWVAAVPAQDDGKLASTIEKFSYAMGYRMAKDLLRQNMTLIDPKALAAGVDAGLKGEAFGLTGEDMQQVIPAYQQLVMEKGAALAEQNKRDGDVFLQSNKSKEGIQVFANGVQYKILVEGDGKKPKADDTVKVHYVGRLLDGQIFDSSRQRGEAAEFNLSGVIKGWTETLQKMPVGSRWMVWVPPEMAYGSRGAGGKIGPNQTLEFDIELLGIVKKKSG